MAYSNDFAETEPTRETIDTLREPTVVEFGTSWCGYCQNAQSLIAKAFEEHPNLAHIKVEDGPGRPLGRSFKVKLWPTLLFLKEGKEVARLVRPQSAKEIIKAMKAITL